MVDTWSSEMYRIFMVSKVMGCFVCLFVLLFQARPEPDSLEEADMNEDEEEKEADVLVPGSSYIKLLSLTPPSVLGGKRDYFADLISQ